MQQILPQIAREQQAGRDCVLVTLISSNGSAPRKAGSQMLAGGAGLLAGTSGGGAVEGTVWSSRRACASSGAVTSGAFRSTPANAATSV